mmetsp:Transcript_22002/g.87330  ORF Transcript_22002/g.87330 Transcript_22002/m.87330 type:complete len:355 (-) Transcript_22002:38-1102(-)
MASSESRAGSQRKKTRKPKTSTETHLDRLCRAREAEYATSIPVGGGPDDSATPRVKLEARVANQTTGRVAVIFCPALPPAGTMYIPEIGVLQAHLAGLGYVTVRFNFRGVGASEGNLYLRSPTTEVDDVRDVARWLAAQRRHHGLPALDEMWIVGVSYGSVVGSAAARFDEFSGYVAVAYPYNYLWYCTNFDGSAFFELAKSRKPKLFVWGATDVFAGETAMRECFENLPEPKAQCVLGALDSVLGHYFRTKKNLDALVAAVESFLTDHAVAPTVMMTSTTTATSSSAATNRQSEKDAPADSSAQAAVFAARLALEEADASSASTTAPSKEKKPKRSTALSLFSAFSGSHRSGR